MIGTHIRKLLQSIKSIAIGADFIFVANTDEPHFLFWSSDTLYDTVIMIANLNRNSYFILLDSIELN